MLVGDTPSPEKRPHSGQNKIGLRRNKKRRHHYGNREKETDRLAQQIQKKRQSQKTLDRYLQNEQAAKRKKNQLE
ncbi:hypothetical protein [Ruminococcus albus]|uniref:hypothetical protein n=1 Tax=Ruminococcus albus TaxID=1264 RepID=UPI000465967A|nr:hypothetical protein [Ruminococcus albus]